MMDPINDWFDLVEVGEAYLEEENYLAATAEFLVLHVDMQTCKSTPVSPGKLSFLKKLQEEDAHEELSQYGGGIQLRSS